MIAFENVSLDVLVNAKRRRVLKECSFRFDDPRMVVIESEPPLRASVIGLVTGRLAPQKGRVRRGGRVSWAIGPTLPFRSNLTGWQTLSFICDVYELRRADAAAMAREMIDAPYDMDAPTMRWPVPAVIQLSYVLALLPRFDIYVIDGPLRLGYAKFYDTWSAIFTERVRGRPLIVSTAQTALAPKLCPVGALLENGRLRRVDNVQEHLSRLRPQIQSVADDAVEQTEEDETDIL